MFSPVGFPRQVLSWTILGMAMVPCSLAYSQAFRPSGLGAQDVSKSQPAASSPSAGNPQQGLRPAGQAPPGASTPSRPPSSSPPNASPVQGLRSQPSSSPSMRPAPPSSRGADSTTFRPSGQTFTRPQTPAGQGSSTDFSNRGSSPSRGVSGLRQQPGKVITTTERPPKPTPMVSFSNEGGSNWNRRSIQGLRPGSSGSGAESESGRGATGFTWVKRPENREAPKSDRSPFIGSSQGGNGSRPTLGLRPRNTPSTVSNPSLSQNTKPTLRPSQGGTLASQPTRGTGSNGSLGTIRRSEGLTVPGSSGSLGSITRSEGLKGGGSTAGIRRSVDSLRAQPGLPTQGLQPTLGSGNGVPAGSLALGNQATFDRLNGNLARLGTLNSQPSMGSLALLGAGSNISQLPNNLASNSGWRSGRLGSVPTFHGSELPYQHLNSVQAVSSNRVLFDDSDLRARDFAIRSTGLITPAPAYFRPIVQPTYVTSAYYGYGWAVPSSSLSVSFVSGNFGLSWNYYDGRFCYDQVYVGRLLAPLGIVPVGGYDGLIIGGRYYAHGYGWLDGCLYYGSSRVWVPGFWAPQTTQVCEDTYEWIPAQYDWVWTGYDWEWLVVDGGYYVERPFDSCNTVTRWVWIPGHWQRGWRG